MTMTRSEFMRTIVVGGGALAAGGIVYGGRAMAQTTGGKKKKKDRGPRLSLEQVEKFVRVAHTDLDATRSLLEEQPKLVNAAWDWGGGDFETALGGASHMGSREIAGLLLDHGARIDLFCAATMGMLEVVRSVVEVYPRAVEWKGPHGISLLRHAVLGEAERVAEFLRSKGAA